MVLNITITWLSSNAHNVEKSSWNLAKKFTVVCSDLRGYGDSDKPASDKKSHLVYSKYKMASDQHKLMLKLGFKSIFWLGMIGELEKLIAINYNKVYLELFF